LSWFIEFNPYFRLSGSEALKEKIFDEIRDKVQEKQARAPSKLQLDIDMDESFDY